MHAEARMRPRADEFHALPADMFSPVFSGPSHGNGGFTYDAAAVTAILYDVVRNDAA